MVSAMLPGALEEAGGEDAVLAHYATIPAGPRCVREHEVTDAWTGSKRFGQQGLIINFGEGTTATRFLACVMDGIGYSTIHNNKELNKCAGDGTATWQPSGCREEWDKYDFIADTPVPAELTKLMATHHHRKGAAAYMLSLRDPVAWAKSRVHHHWPKSQTWAQTAICGDESNLLTSFAKVPLHKLVYDSFAHCLATSDRYGSSESHLFMFNMFSSDNTTESNANFSTNLHNFLNRDRHHGAVPQSQLTLEKISQTVDVCSAQGGDLAYED